MTNDRFDDDAEPTTGTGDGYRTDLGDEPDVDLDVYAVVRIPTSPVLARIKDQTDPRFNRTVSILMRHDDAWPNRQTLFEEAVGRRIKVAKTLLGVDDVHRTPDGPAVAVIEDDPRVAWLNDWADDPVSAYGDREVPDHIERVVDALPGTAKDTAYHGIQAYKGGEVTRRELETGIGQLAADYDVDFAGEDIVVEGDTVATVTDASIDVDSDAFAKHTDGGAEWSARHVVYLILIGAGIVLLIFAVLTIFAPK